MRIESLLNPSDCGTHHGYRTSESPSPAATPRSVGPNTSYPKRIKVPKDAAIFTDAKTNGPVNFPPFEYPEDEELRARYRELHMYPLGNIAEKSARRIPYTSDKKDFIQKTGRDGFEVFQYEFRVPGEDRVYNVLWDYQVGLVRITAFFKCCKYSKTTPAKVLNLNPGLRDICYSITGGALAAQGYWMPYEAAKAVAATFCYNIRYALVPLFGKDFLDMCIPSKDANYAKFLIDPKIVRNCTDETNKWKTEGGSYRTTNLRRHPSSKASSTPSMPSMPSTPAMPFASPAWGYKSLKQHQKSPGDQESGYGTDDDLSKDYLFSPEVSPRSNAWTTVNRSLSPSAHPPLSPPQRWLTSVPGGYVDEQVRAKRTLSKTAHGDVAMPDCPPSTVLTYGEDNVGADTSLQEHTPSEIDAAEILLGMSNSGSTLPRSKRTRRGTLY